MTAILLTIIGLLTGALVLLFIYLIEQEKEAISNIPRDYNILDNLN